MSTHPSAAPSSHDRFSFAFFLAAAVHGLLIFGLAFDTDKAVDSTPSVAVTLATHQSHKAPDEADFIAQANQIGSGTLDERQQITTDQLSPFSSEAIAATQLQQQQQASRRQADTPAVISTRADAQTLATKPQSRPERNPEAVGKDAQDVQLLSREIASLTAKLDRQRQQYAKRPRERVLTSLSTKTARDAAYLHEWTRKVEWIGNKNFPRAAIQQQITGSLRLQAIIKWDGSLLKADILNTSGQRLLDSAALQIIHQAAPFTPFPPEIRKDTDQLVIIRTWNFEINGLSTSQ
ncbi:MAG: TonB family protein [Cellvibrionaceae bacterium]|nr:TonB family protein [Cellvibrionaceae bacterium]